MTPDLEVEALARPYSFVRTRTSCWVASSVLDLRLLGAAALSIAR
jgi:hypothetical protein